MGRFELPVLLLTTTGRRSGKQRTVPLLYLEEDGALLVVASNGAEPNNPGWYHNLAANPAVEVQTRAGRRSLRAEPVAGEDRHPRFERFKTAAKRYATYESQTEREIPVVALREGSA